MVDSFISENEIDFREDEIASHFNQNSYAEFSKKSSITSKLIYYQEGRFFLDKKSLDFLRSIEEEIIIVAFTGKAKTGKSTLINLLINSCSYKGFEIGNGTSQCTKGIWINPELSLGEKSGTKILFLDCEAVFNGRENSFYKNNYLYFLILFISSMVIHNTNTNVEHALEEICDIQTLTEAFNLKGKSDKNGFLVECSPKFLWLLRDFSGSKIEPDTKKELSSKEYLDNQLRGKLSEKYSKIKDTFLKFFPDRDSHTIVTPLKNDINIEELKTMNLENFMNDFKQDVQNLKKKIFRDLNGKKIKGKKLNGFTIANLLDEYISIVNDNQKPEINSIWDNIIKKDIDFFYNRALSSYLDSVKKISNEVSEQDELVKNLYKSRLESMMNFNQIFMLNQDTFNNFAYTSLFNTAYKNLETEITKNESNICNNNIKNSAYLCEEIVEKNYQNIKNKKNENFYNLKTTEDLIKDFESFLTNYNNNALGPMKLRVLIQFLKKNNPDLLENYISKVENDNNQKIIQYSNTLEEMEKKKIEIIKQKDTLKNISEEKEQKINDLTVKNKKKSNEIQELNERIKHLEEEINKKKKLPSN